ncbi:MAG: class I SAM-dependent methyltransferase [Euryarchaeota archaeon]|nr:class I SAM-dependent methyltransferase [Euryarchaeota archaeon]
MAGAHWTEQLFLEHADIFLRIHEDHIERAEGQAREVMGILARGNATPPREILDAPCGIGRHAVYLAKSGYRVTGIDFAPAFLERGRRLAAELGASPEFVLGDLREVERMFRGREGTFSAILNLWTSLGYWGEAVDRDILRQFHRLAAPGGLLIVDTVNRDFLVKNFQKYGYEEWGDLVHIEERMFDPGSPDISSQWAFYTRKDRDLIHRATIPIRHRLYGPHELKRVAESAGWRTLGLFGNLAMEELTADRSRIVLAARKEG